MALSVIGAGLGRTGTKSLKLALEQLGFGPCFHMAEFFASENGETLKEKWERVASARPQTGTTFSTATCRQSTSLPVHTGASWLTAIRPPR